MVGLGPGSPGLLAPAAKEALSRADTVVGYITYIRLIEPLIAGKTVLASGMKKEVERARVAVAEALAGRDVVMVSSGDPGVYGMAGPVLELAPENLDVRIIPGVTAATAAAAALGAPLIHDFAVISLSDLLTPWDVIAKRLAAAAAADFVIVLYNPRSAGREEHFQLAREILLRHRSGDAPAGYVQNCGRDGEIRHVGTLQSLNPEDIDMNTTVIVGNSRTKVRHGRMVTPRGYTI